MSDQLRILLVDDHVLFRDGLSELLSEQKDMHVIGCAANGLEALQKVRELMPDIVMMDIDMPEMDGLEATRAIAAEMPYIKIIMLTVHEEEEKLFAAIKYGAQGYLLKNIRTHEMLEMLRGTATGEAPISRLMASCLLKEFAQKETNPGLLAEKNSTIPVLELDQLSLREREVLELVAQRASNKEIAHSLSISEYTVKNHLRNILAKLHLRNRSQAASVLLQSSGKVK